MEKERKAVKVVLDRIRHMDGIGFHKGGGFVYLEGPSPVGEYVIARDARGSYHLCKYAGQREGVTYVQKFFRGRDLTEAAPLPAGWVILGEHVAASYIPWNEEWSITAAVDQDYHPTTVAG